MRTVLSAALAVASLLAVGCSKKEQAETHAPSAGPAAAPQAASPGVFGTAAIAGEVKFLGKEPENPAIDMSEEPKCKADYATTPRQPLVVVNSNHTLANVLVYVKSGLPAGATYAPPSTPVVLDQKGCLYHPRVFGIMVGQPLSIENSDPLLHNIKALGKNNRPFNISQPVAGMKTERTFTAPEVMLPFECNVHGWMHAAAAVLSHPFFAVTGSDGKFVLPRLPAGTYTIEAWHEKYGAEDVTVTVKDGETKTLTLNFPKAE